MIDDVDERAFDRALAAWQAAHREELRGLSAGEIVARFKRSQREPAPPPPAPPAPPALSPAAIRAMSPADQRKLAGDRWPEVKAALAGKRPPGPLSTAELADLAGTLARSPELPDDPARWAEITEAMKSKKEGTR